MNSIWRTLTLFVFFTAALEAGEPKRMTNSDVVSMVKAELPESVVVLAIQKSAAGFDISAQALIALKSDGVGPKIIEAILTRQTAAPTKEEIAPPTEAEVQQMFQELAQKQSGGILTVVTVKKANGQRSAVNGIQIYEMEFEMVINFGRPCIWRVSEFSNQLTFQVAELSRQTGLAGLADNAQNPGAHVQGGAAYGVKGDVRLELAERGWMIKSMTRGQTRQVDAGEIKREEKREEFRKLSSENEARVRAVPAFTAADLDALLKQPSSAPVETTMTFASENGKITTTRPAGYVVVNSAAAGRFERKAVGGGTEYIAISCKPTALLNRNPSLESVYEAWQKDERESYPGLSTTGGVPSKLMGVDAVSYSNTFVETGRVWQTICTVTVSKKHITAVILKAPAENIRDRFAEYQRVREALALNVK